MRSLAALTATLVDTPSLNVTTYIMELLGSVWGGITAAQQVIMAVLMLT